MAQSDSERVVVAVSPSLRAEPGLSPTRRAGDTAEQTEVLRQTRWTWVSQRKQSPALGYTVYHDDMIKLKKEER